MMGHWQAKDAGKESHGSVVDSTLSHLDLRFGQSLYRGEKKITLRNQALEGFICRLAGGHFLGENERSLSRAVSSEREVGVVLLRRGSRSFAAFEPQSVWIARRQ